MDKVTITGVYKILNNITGDFYIGSSCSIMGRWYNHKRVLKKGQSHNQHLQRAWNKYGADAFEFIVLEECTREIMIDREQFYLDSLKPVYNIRKQCGDTSKSSVQLSDEAKRRRQVNSTLGKKVNQFNLNGVFIREFPSVSEAARTIKCRPSQIFEVLKGDRKSCKGYQWSYSNTMGKYFVDITARSNIIRHVNEKRWGKP